MKTHKKNGAATTLVLNLCTRWSRMVSYALRPL